MKLYFFSLLILFSLYIIISIWNREATESVGFIIMLLVFPEDATDYIK